MFHQIHLIDLYPLMMRLRFLVEEECRHPNAATLDLARVLQRYMKLLLMGEWFAHNRIRDTLAPLIERNRLGHPTPDALHRATIIEEEIHDELLQLVRVFLTLDEGETVVEIYVGDNADGQIVVEERTVIEYMENVHSDREFGQMDAEEQALRKMVY